MKYSKSRKPGEIGAKKRKRNSMRTFEPGTPESPAYPVVLLWETLSWVVALIVGIFALSVLPHICDFTPGMRTGNAKDATDISAAITQNIGED